ncbi:MAG: hypothetical protein ABII12_10570 [Planctomycetota bacterium]
MSSTNIGSSFLILALLLGLGILVGSCILIVAIVRRRRAGVGIAVGVCVTLVLLVALGAAATLLSSRKAQTQRVGAMVEQQRALATIRGTRQSIDSAKQDFEERLSIVIQGPPAPFLSWEDSLFVVEPDEDLGIAGNQTVRFPDEAECVALVERHGEGDCESTVKPHAKAGGKSAVSVKDRTAARIMSLPLQVGVLALLILLAYLFVDARGRRRYTWARRITAAAAFTAVCLYLW